MSTDKQGRMWFAPRQIETQALRRIIRSNRNRLETELAEMLREVMVATDCNEICYCLNDLLRLLTLSNVKAEKAQVRNIVIDNWKLTPHRTP